MIQEGAEVPGRIAAAFGVGRVEPRLGPLSGPERLVRPGRRNVGRTSSRPDAALDLIRPLRSRFNGVSEGIPLVTKKR